jgi:hypothetical protein
VTPPPYPPNTLEQQVLFVPTLDYELTADIVTKNENPMTTVQNVDAGRIRVDVNGSPVGSYNFTTGAGNISGQAIWRAKLCLRFKSTATGTVPLTFNFERSYLLQPHGDAARPDHQHRAAPRRRPADVLDARQPAPQSDREPAGPRRRECALRGVHSTPALRRADPDPGRHGALLPRPADRCRPSCPARSIRAASRRHPSRSRTIRT